MTVEERLKLVAAAPQIVQTPGTQPATEARPIDTSLPVVDNPLIATCVDLVKRTASAREQGNTLAALNLGDLQRNYDCEGLLKGLAKK